MFVCTNDGTVRTFKEEGGGSSVPVLNKDFTYTGECQIIDDSDDTGVKWRIKFLTSGTFTLLRDTVIDAFLVGGGGGGGKYSGDTGSYAIGGGGGGYTKTFYEIKLSAKTKYAVIIGNGGTVGTGSGGTSNFSDMSASGGNSGATKSDNYSGGEGANGGSGGGGANYHNKSIVAGNGGSDGSNGNDAILADNPIKPNASGGTGQGTTTREFGESTGDLYSGGGGGYASLYDGTRYTTKIGNGGDGGGGTTDGWGALPNTGGGGGAKYDGASGIVIIRNRVTLV